MSIRRLVTYQIERTRRRSIDIMKVAVQPRNGKDMRWRAQHDTPLRRHPWSARPIADGARSDSNNSNCCSCRDGSNKSGSHTSFEYESLHWNSSGRAGGSSCATGGRRRGLALRGAWKLELKQYVTDVAWHPNHGTPDFGCEWLVVCSMWNATCLEKPK